MSWSESINQSKEYVVAAQQALEQEDTTAAAAAYQQAAQALEQALASDDIPEDANVGPVIVNLVSLLLKADDVAKAQEVITAWLDSDHDLPLEIVSQLTQLHEAMGPDAAEDEDDSETAPSAELVRTVEPAKSADAKSPLFVETRSRSREDIKSIVRALDYLAEDRLKSRAEINAVAELLEVLVKDLPTLVTEFGFDPAKDLMGLDLRGLEQRGKDLSRYNLDLSRLQGADLSLVNLTQSTLREAKLRGAELSGATLNDAKLTNAELQGANLSRAKLLRADLSETKLTGATLRDANLTEASLEEADLRGASLRGADLTRVKMNERTRLDNADLTDAVLNGAQLEGVSLIGIKLTTAKSVRGAKLGNNGPLSPEVLDFLKNAGAQLPTPERSGGAGQFLLTLGSLALLGTGIYYLVKWIGHHPDAILRVQEFLHNLTTQQG